MDVHKMQWQIIDKFFKNNPYCLVNHHIESYNKFFNHDIFNIFKEQNPISMLKQFNETTGEYELQSHMYIGGKEANKIYYGKPTIYDDDNSHFMFPNEARIRNMTYGFTIHFDIDVEYIIEGQEPFTQTIENIFLGKFPIMLHSDLCIFSGMDRHFCFNAGECKNDKGGYFIIDGKEKAIICQEQFANNMINISDKGSGVYTYSASIRSVSEDVSKPVRTMSVQLLNPGVVYSFGNIVVNVPNVRKPVPFFILMRALGVISDKAIVEHVVLDIKKHETYVDMLKPSVHDANKIFTQKAALEFIATFTKGKTIFHAQNIIMDYLLPHIGVDNFCDKAFFLGHMVFGLLQVASGDKPPTDRDSFKYKRIELSGVMIYNLFKEYYKIQTDNIKLKFDRKFYYNENIYNANFTSLIDTNYQEVFRERILETGFKKAFKGNWGATEHTKRLGAVQDLNRLSFNSALSMLRKLNLSMDASAKVVAPRFLHGSQWGLIDPVDTPDGGNVGFHKHMTIMTHITSGYSKDELIKLLMPLISPLSKPAIVASGTKIIVNGHIIGSTDEPAVLSNTLKNYKRIALIPIQTSISWDIEASCINIFTDSGRLTRPIFYIDENRKPSFQSRNIESMSWTDLITGSNIKQEYNDYNKLYSIKKLYSKETNISKLLEKASVLEFMDAAEANASYISTHILDNGYEATRHTHIEIHPSLLLGVMGNQIVFPENNQLPRNLFSCGQSKQAVSLYHSNYQYRIDKMGVVLNSGQIPLVKSRYMQYINNEEHPYGENPIVAIMCYGGYNVEDAILFNEGSVNRGMFRTTYFNMYETRETSTSVANSNTTTTFSDVTSKDAIGTKPGYDYSYLDKNGLIRENTMMDDKKVVIGMVENDPIHPDKFLDNSVFPKKGQLGFVDKAFITEEEEGFRLAKVRIREERIPAIGDKFCSRCGQKGTMGLLIPEIDMPFTHDGIKPDIIINPHALPSRMTIGQLIETIMGKSCLMYGGFGDCTAFNNKGSKLESFGNMLTSMGYHNSGNQVLYNGTTGEQLLSDIFIGPTYYMRLKHMVKDKINYRALGPRTLMTRQTVQGRANDGGLRIGEMERDGVIAHGMTTFLNESMIERGDKYFMAICNKTGCISVYNESKNIFLSPQCDGPLKYNTTVDGDLEVEKVSKYGRSFSIVRVPYAFKLLMQELMVMNVQMRIITEDNIDQLQNMAYSKTMENLFMKDKVDPNTIVERNRSLFNADIIPEIPTPDRDNIPEEDEIEPDDDEIEPDDDEIETPTLASQANDVAAAATTAITNIGTQSQNLYENAVPEDIKEDINSVINQTTPAFEAITPIASNVASVTGDAANTAMKSIGELTGFIDPNAEEEDEEEQKITPSQMLPSQPVININVGTPSQSTFQPQTPIVTPANPSFNQQIEKTNDDDVDDKDENLSGQDSDKKTITLNK